MVGLVPTIRAFACRAPSSRRGCSPQGRAWRAWSNWEPARRREHRTNKNPASRRGPRRPVVYIRRSGQELVCRRFM